MRNIAEEIFTAGVRSVLPEKMFQLHVKLTDEHLEIAGDNYELSQFNHIYVLGAGKAAALMAKEVEYVLKDKITDGHIITKYGHGAKLHYLTLTEAGHPIPDAEGVKGTRKILEIANKAAENDLVICLLSGGASALMADFPETATLNDLKRANELLVTSGANIHEINTVRKHLSNVKGGRLAKAIYPATTISLIISDVIGDKLDVIASGPTVGDSSTFADALSVVDQYALPSSLPASLLTHLQKGAQGTIAETPKPDDPIFEKVRNYIIASNRVALENAATKAKELGFKTHIATDCLQEDVLEVADFIAQTIDKKKNRKEPVCLLFGGEPTVKVSGSGLGGRNQHLALLLAPKVTPTKNITILCAGTDGTDGPTNAAGAVVDNKTMRLAKEKEIDVRPYIENFNSYHFFAQIGGQIITGNTGTNVMDMVVVLINPA